MTIAELLSPHAVIPALDARAKADVIAILAKAFAASDTQLRTTDVSAALLRRERIASTALRDGVAVPHARLSLSTRPVVVFARSPGGLDFTAADGQLTHLLFAIVTPADSNHHLKVLARAARLLSDEAFRTQLMRAQDADEIFELLCARDQQSYPTVQPAHGEHAALGIRSV